MPGFCLPRSSDLQSEFRTNSHPGVLVDSIADASGAVLTGVTVTPESAFAGLTRKATTDAAGHWSTTLLPIGTYRLRAENPFQSGHRFNHCFGAGDRLRVDITRSIRLVQQPVEFSAVAPTLENDSSSIGQLVSRNAVKNPALNGRNFIRPALIFDTWLRRIAAWVCATDLLLAHDVR